MKQSARRFYYIFLSTALLLPLTVAHAGLVPCGNPAQGTTPKQDDCTFAFFFKSGGLIDNIITFLLYLSAFLAAIAFAWAGVILLTDGGNEGKRKKAKEIILYAVLGLAFALAAWLIVNTIFSTLTNIQLSP